MWLRLKIVGLRSADRQFVPHDSKAMPCTIARRVYRQALPKLDCARNEHLQSVWRVRGSAQSPSTLGCHPGGRPLPRHCRGHVQRQSCMRRGHRGFRLPTLPWHGSQVTKYLDSHIGKATQIRTLRCVGILLSNEKSDGYATSKGFSQRREKQMRLHAHASNAVTCQRELTFARAITSHIHWCRYISVASFVHRAPTVPMSGRSGETGGLVSWRCATW